MQRIAHGSILPSEPTDAPAVLEAVEISPSLDSSASSDASPDPTTRCAYLFDELQDDPAHRLPESPATVQQLIELGETMFDPDNDPAIVSNIPSAYTYFGQFVDHDITLISMPRLTLRPEPTCDFTATPLAPLPLKVVLDKVRNKRSPILELDVIYKCPAPRDGERMHLGQVSKSGLPLIQMKDMNDEKIDKDENNDLPRQSLSSNKKFDRAALIGDPRNDQNLIASQLHVAFLRAHNAIVDRGNSFEKAQTLLRQHYQWILIDDFLKTIADPAIVDDILTRPDPLYNPLAGGFFMPLEFTVAAYRFGHSMVRSVYYFNQWFLGIGFDLLFTLKMLGTHPTLPDSGVIQWEHFVKGGGLGNLNLARPMDTQMTEPLFKLLNEVGDPMPCERRLAVLSLLRGYILRMPTGQAVARALMKRGRNVPVMTAQEIEDKAANKKQRDLLKTSRFSKCTPLWFYILAEAAHFGGGNRLGPVGSTLVAEVLIGLVRRSSDPILGEPGTSPTWSPTLGTTTGKFDLRDLLRLAKVL